MVVQEEDLCWPPPKVWSCNYSFCATRGFQRGAEFYRRIILSRCWLYVTFIKWFTTMVAMQLWTRYVNEALWLLMQVHVFEIRYTSVSLVESWEERWVNKRWQTYQKKDVQKQLHLPTPVWTFVIKEGRKEIQRYVAIFTCLSSRCIHGEYQQSWKWCIHSSTSPIHQLAEWSTSDEVR